jgi:hypothetical protein
MVQALTGVHVSEATTRRHICDLATAEQDVHTAQVRHPQQERPSSAMVRSPDAAMVPFGAGQWADPIREATSERWPVCSSLNVPAG